MLQRDKPTGPAYRESNTRFINVREGETMSRLKDLENELDEHESISSGPRPPITHKMWDDLQSLYTVVKEENSNLLKALGDLIGDAPAALIMSGKLTIKNK
jgi:hypothetical protein